jgi:hypothetical protein
VTQANVQSTICRSGYTETVRPPEPVTEAEKRASLAAYGDAGRLHDYEYDHLVPLELGGADNDPRNLWPEPGASPNPKDALEDRLRSMVCDGRLKLSAAQRENPPTGSARTTGWFGEVHAVGVRIMTGITRSVFAWYSAKPGERSAWWRYSRSRSSLSASEATTSIVSVPTSIETFG